MKGQLFVISSPSGGGKSTVIRALRDRIEGLAYSISHTSRPHRENEKDGIEYFFVDRGCFERMIEQEAFVEWAEVYDELYGTSFSVLQEKTDLGFDVLLDLDIQGALNIKRHFQDSVLIYLLPPSLKTLEKRLVGRGADRANQIKKRLSKALDEIQQCFSYDYIVINDGLEKAILEAQSIILSHRCRANRRTDAVKGLYGLSPP